MDIRHSLTLVETAIYNSLLAEGAREDFLLKTYGGKIEAKLARDPVGGISNAESLIERLASFDPTQKKLYTQWLAQRWLDGSLGLNDDIEPSLTLFDKFKGKLESKDINQYKSFAQLSDAVAPLKGQLTKNDSEREISKQANIIYNDSEYKIIIPETKEASCYYGRNTKWCTAAQKDNMFDRYNDYGKLYIILDKKNNDRWQFCFEKSEFKDARNEDVDVAAFLEKHPPVKQFFDNLFGVAEPLFVEGKFAVYKRNDDETYDIRYIGRLYTKPYATIYMERSSIHWVDGVPETWEAEDIAKILNDVKYPEVTGMALAIIKSVGIFYSNGKWKTPSMNPPLIEYPDGSCWKESIVDGLNKEILLKGPIGKLKNATMLTMGIHGNTHFNAYPKYGMAHYYSDIDIEKITDLIVGLNDAKLIMNSWSPEKPKFTDEQKQRIIERSPDFFSEVER